MIDKDKKLSLEDLKQIPGVGDKTAEDLWNMGICSMGDVGKRSPDELYNQLCVLQNRNVDRCMLYIFRCAVYYVSNSRHDPELLKWWNWKGRADKI